MREGPANPASHQGRRTERARDHPTPTTTPTAEPQRKRASENQPATQRTGTETLRLSRAGARPERKRACKNRATTQRAGTEALRLPPTTRPAGKPRTRHHPDPRARGQSFLLFPILSGLRRKSFGG
jgi:hypothetical protein